MPCYHGYFSYYTGLHCTIIIVNQDNYKQCLVVMVTGVNMLTKIH